MLSFTITGANTLSPKLLEYSAIFLRRSGDSISFRSCMVSASTSSNGKVRQFFPSSITSGRPPTGVTTQGMP